MSSRQHPLAPKRSSTAAAGAASGSKHAKPMDSVETLVGSEKVSMESFELMRMLGKGAYGKVFLVRKVGGSDQGSIYAMKVLKKSRVMQKQKTLEHTMSERTVLEHIKNSPFLVNLRYAFQTDVKLHLVMDYVRGGELFTHLCARGSFDMATTQYYIGELVLALDHVHQKGIFYRDLKLENVMLDHEGHITLTDFGLSKEFDDDELRRANSYCGTIEYMAPEVVQRTEKGYNHTVDWWSLGVLTFELLTGCSPFTVEGAKNSSKEIAERILAKKVPFPKTMDPTVRDFIEKMLSKKGADRLGANGVHEIKTHKFFKGLDWEALGRREIPPPIQPKVSTDMDVTNFSDEFTKQAPVYSPVESPDGGNAALKLFRGYSYISPSVMLSNNNVIGQEYIASLNKSVKDNWDLQKFGEDQNSPFFKQYTLDLTEKGCLGNGAFSVVRRCVRKENGANFAVKVISQRFGSQGLREAQILEMCKDHPSIVKLHDVLQDQFHIYLVLELLEGPELLERIKSCKSFTEQEAAKIFRRIVSAVNHVHKMGAVHRDLKPENIIFESADEACTDLRLIDFGFARLLPTAEGAPLNTPCFTLHYAAPEVLHKDNKGKADDWLPSYNQQCDLWSLGVILFTMLSGRIPFHTKTKFESATDIMDRIRKAEFSFKGVEWHGVSLAAKHLIKGLLTVNPDDRLGVDDLLASPWFKQENIPATPLATPTVLAKGGAARTFNETINAFRVANMEGFKLHDVAAAPLVQRRKMKLDANNSTTDSDGGEGSTGSEKGRKRKLFPVEEEAGGSTIGESMDMDTSASQSRRPSTLPLDAVSSPTEPMQKTPLTAEFTEYRNPKLRQTRDTVDERK